MEITEIKAGEALTELNDKIDAVFVDDNNSAVYLPDAIGEMESDETMVIVEYNGDDAILTRMEDGYRAGHYGTVYTVERAEGLGY